MQAKKQVLEELLKKAHLVPPTFESSRENNQFTSRLLLHHFLDESDLKWLSQYEGFSLNDGQKQALVFVREVGAIDNRTYRQMANCDALKASTELRVLKGFCMLDSKGKGKGTYYVRGKLMVITQGHGLITQPSALITQADGLITQADGLITQADGLITQADGLITQPNGLITQAPFSSEELKQASRENLINELPIYIQELLSEIKPRENDANKISDLILRICKLRPYKSTELSLIINKREDYLRKFFLTPLVESKKLSFTYPEMKNHPDQGYEVKE